jgi:hypothetical protein
MHLHAVQSSFTRAPQSGFQQESAQNFFVVRVIESGRI